MPQLQNLILTDRAATPKNHTYTPRDIVNGLGTVIESSGVPIGNNRVSVALNRTPSGKYKAVIKFAFPVVQTQTINGVSTPSVVRTSHVDVVFTFENSSTVQERNDVVGMVMSSFAADKTLINDTVVNLQGVY